jgi:hypothetical protein
MNVTVTMDAQGNIQVSASTNTILPTDNIVVNNQTPSQLYAMLDIFPAVITAAAGPPTAGMLGNGPIAANSQSGPLFLAAGQMKMYLGFSDSGSGVFSGAPTDDTWFCAPPNSGAILPLRVQGAMDVILTPQHDPNPPHSLHPVVTSNLNVTAWDATNPGVVWILNSSGLPATFYVKVFFSDTTPSAYYTFSLPSNLCYYTFPAITGGNIAKFWYGFAYSTPAEYNGAEAFFAAHPAGSAGHHTGELPPVDAASAAATA